MEVKEDRDCHHGLFWNLAQRGSISSASFLRENPECAGEPPTRREGLPLMSFKWFATSTLKYPTLPFPVSP